MTTNLTKKFSRAAFTLLTATTLAQMATPVFAQATSPDATSSRSLTIHANAGANTGQVNNQGQDVPTLDGQNPMAGISFKYVQIKPLSGQSAATMKANDATTYQVVSGGNAGTLLTDNTGTASVNLGQTNGYYLVTQTTTSDGITQMKPFIAQVPMNSTGQSGDWNYAVNVYPKLDMSQDKGSDKMIGLADNDGSVKQDTIFAGADVTWNLATTFSKSMRLQNDDGSYKYGNFVLTDQLNPKLTYKSISFSTAVQDTDDNDISKLSTLTLTADTDYTLTVVNNLVTLQLTNSGIDKVLAALPATATDEKALFIANLTTTVAADYQYGQIGNTYGTAIDNAFGTDLSTPTSNPGDPDEPGGGGDTPGNTPEVYLGAVKIGKVDSVSKTALAGATFAIAATADNAKAGNYIQVDDATGQLYADSSQVPSGHTSHDYAVTTDSMGAATFGGLELTDGADATGVTGTQKTYYVVETDAPEGYDLPTSPFIVTASYDGSVISSLDNSLDGNEINLPFSGGVGLVGLLLIAGTATGALLTIRHLKAKQ
ncbi:MAG: SpaH/EbpB family LPXTG-anchored major pilin [Streptococcaceae bacterium]|jgi:hypothetical protein|nr:SpaH/EbpB family LPXTG-anchored major pilin [Streptococcaceae bacterium]